jgi:3',5'-cyclic-AMP phosphodiesterase
MTDRENAGPDRRGALKCLAWAGTGALFSINGGIASSLGLEAALAATTNVPKNKSTPLSFVQISDSHIGFRKPANPDPLATLRETIARIKALPTPPAFVLHTGDITHLATPEQFDMAQSMLSEIGVPVHFVPGEHDIVDGNDPRPYLARFGKGTLGDGWYSFDAGGTHFIALVNAIHLRENGMGSLGVEQLSWLRSDIAPLSASTPIVVFAHFPMWALFPQWGFATADAAAAVTMLRRFGSVTVLNGHIHQIQQRIEGHVMFHTARSTAFPQPAPGDGPGPGPLLLPAEQLRGSLGFTSVKTRIGQEPIAVIDSTLASA